MLIILGMLFGIVIGFFAGIVYTHRKLRNKRLDLLGTSWRTWEQSLDDLRRLTDQNDVVNGTAWSYHQEDNDPYHGFAFA